MKKKKPISILALVFSASFILASCNCSGPTPEPSSSESSTSQSISESSSEESSSSSSVSSEESSISSEESSSSSSESQAPVVSNFQVDLSNVKTVYELGEALDTTGIVATATITENGESRTLNFANDDLNIDGTAFNNALAGTYGIAVSPKAYPDLSKNVDVYVYGNLQVDGAKTVFALNEEFSRGDIVLTYYRGVNAEGQTMKSNVNPNIAQVSIDSSAFDSTRLGTYNIVVSYAISSRKTLTATYSVEVQSKVAGLAISKTVTSYTLEGNLTTTIALDDIVVKGVDQYGLVEETPLTNADYTLSFYKNGTEKIDSVENVGPGIYQIWAERQITLYGEVYDLSDFVIVYVNDPVTGITLNEGATLTQEEGKDTISETWSFSVAYSSGRTETVTAEDVKITGLDTKTVAESAEATISYTAVDSDGTSRTVNTKVTYSITAAASEDTGSYKEKHYSQLISADHVDTHTAELSILNDEDNGNSVSILADSSHSVVVEANSATYGDRSFTHRAKLGGQGSTTYRALKIVVSRDATFRTWFKTGSSKEDRSLKLYDSTGAYVDGTEVTATGNDISQMEVELAAGTYYVWGAKACNVYGIEIDTTVLE